MPVLFPFKPDWNSPFSISREFRTSILTSREFREQRIAERRAPRMSLSFALTPLKDRVRQWFETMALQQQGIFWVADWTRWVLSTTEIAISDSQVEVAAVPGWLMAGQSIMLSYGGETAVYEIDSMTSTEIIFTTAVSAVWPVGTRVYPLLEGVFSQNIRGSLITGKAGKFTLDFAVDPGKSADVLTGSEPTFNGRPLWLKRPNWNDTISESLRGYLETVDFDRGIVDHYAPIAWNTRIKQATYLFKNQAEAEAFIGFSNQMKGQRGEFYAPTWTPDFDLSIGAASGSNSITVPGLAAYETYSGSTVYKAAIALFRDGTYQANRITSVASASGNTQFTFASNWTRAVNSATTRVMSMLPVWRFGADEMTLEWLTATVAETKLSTVTLEDL